jgi:hypothetical protein
MNNKRFILAAAAVVLAACSQEVLEPAVEQVPVSLTYSTVDAVESKAAQNLNEGTFASGESVLVRVSNTGTGSWTDYTFTTGDAGAMTPPNPGPYYPAGSQNIDIVAYYPATAGTSFTVATDQTADASYKASDLMFASVTNQAKQAEAVNLAFTHKMAKLNVNITAGSGVSSINSLSVLNVKPSVSFDQATGAVGSASGDATSIAMSNNGAVVIPAQTIDGGLLSIVTDKGTAIYTVACKEFTAGQQYTLNITVNLRAIGNTNAITGWTSEGTVTVVAERPNIAGHEYVDMGTVSIGGVEKNLKWATCNLGATDPWEYGDYYAWGATVPFYLAGHSQDNPCSDWIDGKSGYNWSNYPFGRPVTKYTDSNTSFADYGYADDAARQRWGGTWRIPTDEEWTALRNDSLYDWVWTTDYLGSGKNGMLVTRKSDTGPCSGNSIFLPAAGSRSAGSLDNAGSLGDYWSSSLFEEDYELARKVYIRSSGVTRSRSGRYYGQSVRPLTE